jgi:rsbT antagonist protein RsbS
VTVPILEQGDVLIASVQAALTDADWKSLQTDLAARIGARRARGVVLDVTVLDVLDSFATRTLRSIAHVARLRGARVVIAGIQPDVALAMAQLGLTARLGQIDTALDLEAGLAELGRRLGRRGGRRGR